MMKVTSSTSFRLEAPPLIGDLGLEEAVLLVVALQRAGALGELDVVVGAGGERSSCFAQLAVADRAVADELHVDFPLLSTT